MLTHVLRVEQVRGVLVGDIVAGSEWLLFRSFVFFVAAERVVVIVIVVVVLIIFVVVILVRKETQNLRIMLPLLDICVKLSEHYKPKVNVRFDY